jgi:selenocysteine lyase/cysteine desulfurase
LTRRAVVPEDVQKKFKNTKLVLVNHASNVIGTVQPGEEIGKLAASAALCARRLQSAGKIPWT